MQNGSIVEHSPTCCRHGRKPDMSCVMSAPSATHFSTMSATCHLTCRRHVGSDISCLSFWGSGRHADIRHLPTKSACLLRKFILAPKLSVNSALNTYLLVGQGRYRAPICRTPKIVITTPHRPATSILTSPSCSLPPN